MNQLRRFMYGRYGVDQFTRGLIIISVILTLLSSITRFLPLYVLAYIPLVYALFRTFSRDIQRRSQENIRYYNFVSSLKKRLINLKLTLIGTKTHKYYLCPQCKQTIRVPRGKGKIAISCPKCRREFVKRT